MSAMPAQFLSCDWGTSSFRLRLVSTATNETLAKVTATTGVKELFEQANQRAVFRAGLFAEVAAKHIKEIALRHTLNGQPLIISGMASSALGWKELAYAKAPFVLDGTGLRVEELNWEAPEELGPTFIVSGVATQDDVMRGEECQVMGIMAQPAMQPFCEGATVILPGTHSKHIDVEFGRVTGFTTHMTGELFETLANHTVLRPTVDPKAAVQRSRSEFRAGVELVKKQGLGTSLFKVRARSLLNKINTGDNAAFLSGILIGAEVGHLANTDLDPEHPIIVAANEELTALYSLAIGKRKGVIYIQDIGAATKTAHRLILTRLYR